MPETASEDQLPGQAAGDVCDDFSVAYAKSKGR